MAQQQGHGGWAQQPYDANSGVMNDGMSHGNGSVPPNPNDGWASYEQDHYASFETDQYPQGGHQDFSMFSEYPANQGNPAVVPPATSDGFQSGGQNFYNHSGFQGQQTSSGQSTPAQNISQSAFPPPQTQAPKFSNYGAPDQVNQQYLQQPMQPPIQQHIQQQNTEQSHQYGTYQWQPSGQQDAVYPGSQSFVSYDMQGHQGQPSFDNRQFAPAQAYAAATSPPPRSSSGSFSAGQAQAVQQGHPQAALNGVQYQDSRAKLSASPNPGAGVYNHNIQSIPPQFQQPASYEHPPTAGSTPQYNQQQAQQHPQQFVENIKPGSTTAQGDIAQPPPAKRAKSTKKILPPTPAALAAAQPATAFLINQGVPQQQPVPVSVPAPRIPAPPPPKPEPPQAVGGVVRYTPAQIAAYPPSDIQAIAGSGCPNLRVPRAPINIIVPDNAVVTEDGAWSARFNTVHASLLPQRANRLPGEIQRDWDIRHKALNNAALGLTEAARAHLEQTMRTLSEEMQSVRGRPIAGLTSARSSAKSRKKVSKKAAAGDSGDDTSSSSEEEEEEEPPFVTQARKFAMGPRPEDTLGGVKHAIVKMVWRDPQVRHAPGTAAKSIGAFGDYVGALWAEAKQLRAALKEIGKASDKSKAAKLTADLDTKLKSIQQALETVLEYGDSAIIENMGGNQKLVTILRNVLQHRLSSKDYNGPLPKVILKFMSRFNSIETKFLNGVLKFDKLQESSRKELDKENQGLFNRILENAKAYDRKMKDSAATTETKKTGEVKAEAVSSDSPKKASAVKAAAIDSKKLGDGPTADIKKAANGTTSSATSTATIKRPRDDDTEVRATKKVALESSTSTSAAKPNPSSTASTNVTVPAAAPVRAKTTASLSGKFARPTVKPAVKKEAPAAPSKLSIIGDLLAEIAKPKEAPKPKVEEPVRAPETEEEKQRRLRKESRRRLRVAWKTDDELEEIRYFKHEAAEDEGREGNMIRDARDNRSEGQMFKRAVQQEDDDEDEDVKMEEDTGPEVELRPWQEVTPLDFAGIPADKRAETFVTRGGLKSFHTEDQKVMEAYERNKLMVFYTSSDDIPDTPRSPPATERGSTVPTKEVHLPKETPAQQEFYRRAEETTRLGSVVALQMAQQRLGQAIGSSVSQKSSFNSTSRAGDRTTAFSSSHAPSTTQLAFGSASAPPRSVLSVSEWAVQVFTLLNSDAIRKWVDPNPYDTHQQKTERRHDYLDAKIQQDADVVEDTAAPLVGKPFPPNEPPDWLRSNPDRVKEWYNGHTAVKAKQDAADRAQRFAEEHARKSIPAAQGQATDPNAAVWAAYYAQYGHSQAPSQSQYAQYAAAIQQQQQQQSTTQSADPIAAVLQQVQQYQANQAVQSNLPAATASSVGNDQIQAVLAALGQGGQSVTPAQPQAADQSGQVQALLAALSQPGRSGRAQPGYPTDTNAAANYWQAWAASQAQQPQQSQQQSQQSTPQQQPSDGRENDRGDRASRRNRGWGELDYDDAQRDGKAHHKEKKADRDNRGNSAVNRSVIGTKPCTFWAKGQCAKGDKCTFRHDPNDLK